MSNGSSSDQPPQIDASVPHSARIWNYWLGGKDNYPVDREAGDQFREVFPEIVEVARSSREFLTRAVGYLAGEAGIRQFLDIGTGLPTADNTHEVAQRITPEARVVSVDNDPVVLAHARALLTSTPEGATAYVDADLRDPDRILELTAPNLGPGQAGGTDAARSPRPHRRRRRGSVDRQAPPGRPGVRQLPGPVRRHQHQPGRGAGPGRLRPERRHPLPPAQPRADRRSLRRAGAGGAGRGVAPAVATRPDQRRRPTREVDAVGGVGRKP